MKIKIITILILFFILNGCGKVGPLALPEDKLDKSVITYPCDELCLEKFEAEKIRQQSVIIQTN
jgi:predicted small lipoprotein YifL